jgi:hypothetical protein
MLTVPGLVTCKYRWLYYYRTRDDHWRLLPAELIRDSDQATKESKASHSPFG